MSKPFDYSKWDNIELSDDEDDVHPNIDRESWFRMKHRSRVEREEREDADKKKINEEVCITSLWNVHQYLFETTSCSNNFILLCITSDGQGQSTHKRNC